jgi:nucleotide-binding universal stress UspA family protein
MQIVGQKLLVPIDVCVDTRWLFEWLRSNEPASSAHMILVHVVEPEWISDIPQSVPQARFCLERHARIMEQRQWALNATCARLRKHFTDLQVSGLVLTGDSIGDVIVEQANQLRVSSIILIRDAQQSVSPFARSRRICERIVQRANQVVLIVQKPWTSSSALTN